MEIDDQGQRQIYRRRMEFLGTSSADWRNQVAEQLCWDFIHCWTISVRDLCHLGKGQSEPLLGHHPHCFNLTVLDHSYFYPIKHVDRLVLFQSNKNQFWQHLFSKALSVHFYGSNTSGRGGWLTGKSTAYDYLGKKYCPRIYSIQDNLDLWLR